MYIYIWCRYLVRCIRTLMPLYLQLLFYCISLPFSFLRCLYYIYTYKYLISTQKCYALSVAFAILSVPTCCFVAYIQILSHSKGTFTYTSIPIGIYDTMVQLHTFPYFQSKSDMWIYIHTRIYKYAHIYITNYMYKCTCTRNESLFAMVLINLDSLFLVVDTFYFGNFNFLSFN